MVHLGVENTHASSSSPSASLAVGHQQLQAPAAFRRTFSHLLDAPQPACQTGTTLDTPAAAVEFPWRMALPVPPRRHGPSEVWSLIGPRSGGLALVDQAHFAHPGRVFM